MSNNQPETKQQFGFASAPEGLPPLRLRLAVGGIATVVALTEFGASKPARADHETEEGEGWDCGYGFHALLVKFLNKADEQGCFTRKDCDTTYPLIALPEGAPELTYQQEIDLSNADFKMQCRGDPYPSYDEWFEAYPWAQEYRYRIIIGEEATTPEDSTTETEPDQPEPVVEPTEPETTGDTTPEEVVDEQQPDSGTAATTETEPDQPEPVVEPTEPETTGDTTPEEVVDEQQPDSGTAATTEPDQPEPVVEPTEPETTGDTTPEEVVDEQQPDTGTATTTGAEPEPVVEPTEPETTEDTTPEEVVDEQQPDTGTATTTETEPDQPEPVVEPTEPETTSTTALVEQRPPDTETDTDASVLPGVLVVGAIGAVALSSIYLFKAKKIKMPSRLKRNSRRQ